ncbi:hypothetical protein TWF730_010569 [Orbilia blumenaviensis]|uniref:SET domain-containing protein n=1 Tax=Orbilia blumenaviensis TaxID=1796055 RepID=A0AAV9US24_9PEZI
MPSRPEIPELSAIVPGDRSTYPKDSIINNYTRLSHIPSMGMGLVAAQDLPAGTAWCLASLDNYLPIPRKTFIAIRLAGKKYPEWKNFQSSIEMVAVYSPRFDAVNFSVDNLRFLNHGIVEGEGEGGVGNVEIGGTAVAEDSLVGWAAWTNREIKQGEQLVANYYGFKNCPWGNTCEKFLDLTLSDKLDFDIMDRETKLDEPVELILTRDQFSVYTQSGLEREIDKALLAVIAKWGVWDEGRGSWVIKVPVESPSQ